MNPDESDKLFRTLVSHAKALEAENARLRNWVNDLQSGMYVNCVYCGHRYGPSKDTPATRSDVLKKHIESCPQHPMSRLRELNRKLVHSLELIRDGTIVELRADAFATGKIAFTEEPSHIRCLEVIADSALAAAKE